MPGEKPVMLSSLTSPQRSMWGRTCAHAGMRSCEASADARKRQPSESSPRNDGHERRYMTQRYDRTESVHKPA